MLGQVKYKTCILSGFLNNRSRWGHFILYFLFKKCLCKHKTLLKCCKCSKKAVELVSMSEKSLKVIYWWRVYKTRKCKNLQKKKKKKKKGSGRNMKLVFFYSILEWTKSTNRKKQKEKEKSKQKTTLDMSKGKCPKSDRISHNALTVFLQCWWAYFNILWKWMAFRSARQVVSLSSHNSMMDEYDRVVCDWYFISVHWSNLDTIQTYMQFVTQETLQNV